MKYRHIVLLSAVSVLILRAFAIVSGNAPLTTGEQTSPGFFPASPVVAGLESRAITPDIPDQAFSKVTTSDTTSLVDAIEQAMAVNHWPGLQICLLKEDQLLWSRSFGYADLEDSIPMADTTICVMASTSKPVIEMTRSRSWQQRSRPRRTPSSVSNTRSISI